MNPTLVLLINDTITTRVVSRRYRIGPINFSIWILHERIASRPHDLTLISSCKRINSNEEENNLFKASASSNRKPSASVRVIPRQQSLVSSFDSLTGRISSQTNTHPLPTLYPRRWRVAHWLWKLMWEWIIIILDNTYKCCKGSYSYICEPFQYQSLRGRVISWKRSSLEAANIFRCLTKMAMTVPRSHLQIKRNVVRHIPHSLAKTKLEDTSPPCPTHPESPILQSNAWWSNNKTLIPLVAK